jgi:hypothetical protein
MENGKTFQQRVYEWLLLCFGEEIARDKTERNHRFLEEALELVQSLGCTKSEAHQLVDYTFDRPTGEPLQECGGVVVTLAALCSANGLEFMQAGENELMRIWTKVEKIREKQAAKPKHSPLPEKKKYSMEDFNVGLQAIVYDAREWWHRCTSAKENERLWQKYYPDAAYLTDAMVVNIYMEETDGTFFK